MKIGNIELDNNLVLSPMAGFTDKAYRLIAKEKGVGLVVTEMVSSKGLYYGDDTTRQLTSIDKRERPVALQIFGNDPDIMGKVIEKYINPREDIDILDINMGCPAPKIVKNGDGAALMRDPILVEKILDKAIGVSIKPVTVKIRMGWDDDYINGIEIARIAEKCGVSALTIHGRTRDMFYSGKANWEYIKDVVESVSIPVIGNGDVFQPEDGISLLEYTKCAGIAIGRGAIGNPWLFERIVNMKNGKKDVKPSTEVIIHEIIKHLDLEIMFKGERVGIREMRKHIAHYLKGLKNSNAIKNKINTIESRDEIKDILLKYLEKGII